MRINIPAAMGTAGEIWRLETASPLQSVYDNGLVCPRMDSGLQRSTVNANERKRMAGQAPAASLSNF